MVVQIGFDTFCFYHYLSPKQKKAVIKELKALPKFKTAEDDYENESQKYTSDYFAAQGIKLVISRTKGSVWGLYVIVHPTLALGNNDRSALYQATKSSYKKVVKAVDIPCSLGDMLIIGLMLPQILFVTIRAW